MNFEPTVGIILYIAAVYFATGVVKGVLGIGLPLITIPMLAGTLGPITAMALLAVPTFAVNFAQTAQSGYMAGAFRRFWPAYPLVVLSVIASVFLLLTRLDREALMILVGVVVILVALTQLMPVTFTIPHRAERWCTPLFGVASGIIGGVTGFLGPLMVMYLVALRVDKDQFVGAIALFYMIAALPFFVGLWANGYFGWFEFWASCGAATLIWLGVLVGQRVRARASSELFRKLVLGLLIVIGANMIRKALI